MNLLQLLGDLFSMSTDVHQKAILLECKNMKAYEHYSILIILEEIRLSFQKKRGCVGGVGKGLGVEIEIERVHSKASQQIPTS